MNATAQADYQAVDPAYAPGHLSPAYHARLVDELPRFAQQIGITVADITGENYHLTDFEKDYLLGFRRHEAKGRLGLIYIGRHDPSVLHRCRSVCGALARNYIETRFVPREELISRLFDRGKGLHVPLVAVPDFHYSDAPAATKRVLASWIIGRAARGQQTVLGLPNKQVLSEVFGEEAPMYMNHYEVAHGVT